jgi:hypothetical protein
MEASMSPDIASERLKREIDEARQALLDAASKRPADEWWHAFELKDQARNGWSAGAMNIAFRRLIREQLFEVDGDRIRLPPSVLRGEEIPDASAAGVGRTPPREAVGGW